MDINLKLKLTIDDGIICLLKKVGSRGGIIISFTVASALVSVILFAAIKPHTFTPGTTISSSQVNANFDAAFDAVAKAVPPGTVMAYAGSATPEGYLLCDGSAVSRTIYAILFSSIGTTYGAGDGSTTFNLPDYRGMFLRGHHYGSSKDPDFATRNLGTEQGHLFQDHAHEHVKASDHNYTATGWALIRYNSSANEGTIGEQPSSGNHGSETRPVNRSVSYIIKY